MTDDAFSQKIEWKMHTFIIAFNVIVCVAGLITKTFNTIDGKLCTFNVSPTGCRRNPELYGECDETISRNATFLAFATRFVTTLLCLAGIIVCMVKICWHVTITTNTTRTTRLSNLRGQHHNVTQQTHRDEHNANAADLLVRHYRRQFFIQASLYVLAYASTYSFAWIGFVVLNISKQGLHADNGVFVLLASIFYPLGGLFNILVYTRPKVLSLQRNNPQYSWFWAFILVVRAGGVVPAAADYVEEALPSNVQPRGQEPYSSGGSLLRDLSSSNVSDTEQSTENNGLLSSRIESADIL